MKKQIGREVTLAVKNYIAATEGENFFPTAYHKDIVKQKKQNFFRQNGLEKLVVIINETNFGNVSDRVNDRDVIKITDQELIALSSRVDQLKTDLHGALVVLTNNNVAKIGIQTFQLLVDSCAHTIFAVHDFDNHHWVEMSVAIVESSDVYFPAHLDNYAIASRISPNVIAGIPCGSIQWKREFIEFHSPDLLNTKRSPGPLGKHYFYDDFKYRNQVLHTIGQQFPSVGLLTNDYHGMRPSERWQEWVSSKLHLVVPVFNDLPIRFFDSLITGGIPLVPIGLKSYLNYLGIPECHFLTYSARDIVSSNEFIQSALGRFDRLGNEGIMSRHLYAMSHFHVDVSIRKMLEVCEDIYVKNH
jgi:hypothetical protein